MTKPSTSKQLQRRLDRHRKRRLMVRLKHRGWTLREIADRLGCSFPTVSRELKAADEQWVASTVDEITEMKREVIGECKAVAAVAWKDYDRSRRDKEKRRYERGENGKLRLAEVTREGQCGSPAHLRVVLDALAAVRDITGMDAPKKSELTADLSALTVHEQIITTRRDTTPPGPGELPGQPSDAPRICGGAGNG